MTLTASLLLGAISLLAAGLLLPRKRSEDQRPRRQADADALPSLIIPAYTTHARFLPTPARHAFSYPLLYLGADIDSLENGSVDVGRLVRYGGAPYTKIVGLRGDSYLDKSPEQINETLRSKVNRLLVDRGIEKNGVGRVWLVTIPSFMGFEGINPLSVWYCYKPGEGRELAFVILEVHNTFGEK
jgi:DUF1365 family protein